MTPTNHILNIFEGYRMQPTAIDQYNSIGKPILFQKIESFVSRNRPIEFVMLGFPFKSTNRRDKVLGAKPDMAEQVTLDNMDSFNDHIKQVYKPGVKISMVSDGFIFNDLLEVPEREVEEYQEISMDMGRGGPVEWFNLKNFYPGWDIKTRREKLMLQFGITSEKLEQDILMNPDTQMLYKGMIRFMHEELAYKPYDSGNQLHKAAKKLAREMMIYNEAYSNLVKDEFRDMIRISMHPSVNNGNKYSFKLIPGENANHSAWHCVLCIKDNQFVTMHKKEAMDAGYELVVQNNQPFYFIGK